MVIQSQRNQHVQALRDAYKAQKADGIRSYTLWLEKHALDQEREVNMQVMGAETNFRLWQKASAENDRLLAGIDRLREWLVERGYSVGMIDQYLG